MRAAAGLILFAVGLGFGVTVLAAATPTLTPPLMAERLAEFDVDRDRYDTLFFGSSRMFRGVDPSLFDAETARHDHPTRSFNLAFPGMRFHESNAWLRRILSSRPKSLRYVLIELDEWATEVHDRLPDSTSVQVGRYSARAVAWHDAAETRSVLRSIEISDAPFGEKLDLSTTHLAHWAARAFGIGGAARSLRERIAPAPYLQGPTMRSGFTPYEPSDYRTGLPWFFRRQYLDSMDTYRDAVADLEEANREQVAMDTYNLEALEAQIEMVKAAGATPIYVLPPRGEATPRLVMLSELGYVTAFFDFGQPGLHPDLFALDSRFDAQHMSPVGARIFTTALALRFSGWRDGR